MRGAAGTVIRPPQIWSSLNQKTRDASSFGGKLQPSGRFQIERAVYVGDQGDDTALAQNVLAERREISGIRIDTDQSSGIETAGGETGSMQIRKTIGQPDDPAGMTRKEHGDEAGRPTGGDTVHSRGRDFVDRATQHAPAQVTIDHGPARREPGRGGSAQMTPLDPGDLFSQQGNRVGMMDLFHDMFPPGK